MNEEFFEQAPVVLAEFAHHLKGLYFQYFFIELIIKERDEEVAAKCF